MANRWRGRMASLAILALAAAPMLAAAASAPTREAPALVLTGPGGGVLARVPLADSQFTLRYRNSVYRSLAEERFAVDRAGRMTLVRLGADELAVLEEYYAIDEPAGRAASGARAWEAPPARPVVLDELVVAATDLGRRTLLVEGAEPIELWHLVGDAAPSITLAVEVP